jgi:hypothetical protein
MLNFMAGIWMLGCGVFSNLTDSWFVRFLSWTSPLRYGCEIVFRVLIKGIDDEDVENKILDRLGYTYGNKICFGVLLAFIFVFFCLCLLVINLRNSKYV